MKHQKAGGDLVRELVKFTHFVSNKFKAGWLQDDNRLSCLGGHGMDVGKYLQGKSANATQATS